MLKSDFIDIKKTNSSKFNNYFLKLGYTLENDTFFNVKISDLSYGSKITVDCVCDKCGNLKNLPYRVYILNIKNCGYYSCSNKCSIDKKIKTNLEKYGVEHYFQSDDIKIKGKITNLEKYGTEHPQQNQEIRNKNKITNLEKYGYEYTFQSEIVKDKIMETMLLKHNVKNPSHSNTIRNKTKKTNLERYGSEYPTQNENVVQKIKDSNLEKYGHVCTLHNDTIKEKSIKTLNENLFIKYKENINNNEYEILKFEDDILTINHISCNSTFTICRRNYHERRYDNINICTNCYPISTNKSIKERELIDFIKSNNIEYFESDKTVLLKKHLDVYIPSHNLAIEFNGLYWHSEKFNDDKNYHLNKSLQCQNKGIHLMHIWEDEWVYKQDIVKSIISNRLGKIENKIFARNCSIKEVKDSKLVRKFLDDNHIQGYSQSSIKLGLYYNNELVSLMTFGYRHTNSKKEFELIRFCNILNTNVIGASSKLFKYFLNNYPHDSILSYSDFRLFDGKMYETLGFENIHLSKPDYFWTKNLERKHRFTFNKQKLIKDGYDPNKTEVEIMHERGYYRIFSCGQVRWEYKRQLNI